MELFGIVVFAIFASIFIGVAIKGIIDGQIKSIGLFLGLGIIFAYLALMFADVIPPLF